MTDVNDQLLEVLDDLEDATDSIEDFLDDELPTGVAIDSADLYPEEDEICVKFELPQVESETATAFDVEYRDVSSKLTVWIPLEEVDR